jgi:hypothetical protein
VQTPHPLLNDGLAFGGENDSLAVRQLVIGGLVPVRKTTEFFDQAVQEGMGERYAEKGRGAARTTLITKTGVTMHTMHALIGNGQGDITICMFRLQVLTSHKVFEETAWNVYIAFIKYA